ncbi:MAG: hypothetical protein KatS3mg115_0655 [Candidatus Poribacteria bacterium]|nr:MAG: hypothetical protein KatS3mg115_0655 [Candidatus Poribacteria bacterium]
MWLILEGSIRVLPNNQDIGVVLEAGEIVGEMSLLDGSPRSATLITDSQTLLLSYTLEDYENTFRDSPEAGLAFLRNLIRRQQNRLRETTQRAAAEAAAKARVEGEIQQAKQTQQLALPRALPKFGNCEFAVSYSAAREVSGDYYDFIELDPDRLIVLFGDSTGHGLNAGLLMLIAKSAALTQARIDPSVVAITSAINDIICEVFEATLFMTFVCALIDRKNRTIEYTNAGQQSHPYLLHVRTDEFVPLSSQTFQLGVQKGAQYISETITYEPRDLLVCYSDGIIEAPYCPPGATEVDRSTEFGDVRLQQFLLDHKDDTPQQIIDALLKEARNFCVFFDTHMVIGGKEYDGDDVTNLVIRLD